jgi:drug/metabolite transporter (DMT)-like permease
MKRGYLLVLGAIILFSTIEVVSKYLQSGEGAAGPVGPSQVATLRFVFGAVFILLLVLGRRETRFLAEAVKKDGLPIALLGAVGVFLTFFLMHEGIETTSASTAAVVFSMNPVFTVLIASLALRERLGLLGWLGVGIGLLGAFAAITGFKLSGLFSRDDFLGSLLVLISAVTWSVYTVYGKKYSERYGSLVLSFLTMVVGSVLLSVLLTVQGGWGEMAGYDLRAWVWLLYLGIITVGVGYILYFGGMRRVPASRGASLFYLKPILAVFIAYLALGEPISYSLLFASLMVAAGILLVTLPREAKAKSAAKEEETAGGDQLRG